LLLVLLGGLTLTTLTRDWIGALRITTISSSGRAAWACSTTRTGATRLIRRWPQLQPPGPILRHEEAFVFTERAAIPDEQFGVVSLQPMSGLQPELNSYTPTGLLALVALVLFAARGRPLLREGALPPAGRSLAPPLPPPQPA
jgi:hypothetical protein